MFGAEGVCFGMRFREGSLLSGTGGSTMRSNRHGGVCCDLNPGLKQNNSPCPKRENQPCWFLWELLPLNSGTRQAFIKNTLPPAVTWRLSVNTAWRHRDRKPQPKLLPNSGDTPGALNNTSLRLVQTGWKCPIPTSSCTQPASPPLPHHKGSWAGPPCPLPPWLQNIVMLFRPFKLAWPYRPCYSGTQTF